jgi:hypothetical protein
MSLTQPAVQDFHAASCFPQSWSATYLVRATTALRYATPVQKHAPGRSIIRSIFHRARTECPKRAREAHIARP